MTIDPIDLPALLGQRVKSVRRMTVAEQNELGSLEPTRPGPVVVELDNGELLFALRTMDGTGRLVAAKDGRIRDVQASASRIEVEG